MDEEKKAVKKAQAYTLKPINIAWLTEEALRRSTPEKRISASSLLDEIVDQARQASQSPLKQKKTTARAVEIAMAI